MKLVRKIVRPSGVSAISRGKAPVGIEPTFAASPAFTRGFDHRQGFRFLTASDTIGIAYHHTPAAIDRQYRHGSRSDIEHRHTGVLRI